MGQIDVGKFPHLDGLACKYHFIAGEDWQVSSGERSGVGQHAFKSQVKNIVWNLPFEITFRTMTPFGWP